MIGHGFGVNGVATPTKIEALQRDIIVWSIQWEIWARCLDAFIVDSCYRIGNPTADYFISTNVTSKFSSGYHHKRAMFLYTYCHSVFFIMSHCFISHLLYIRYSIVAPATHIGSAKKVRGSKVTSENWPVVRDAGAVKKSATQFKYCALSTEVISSRESDPTGKYLYGATTRRWW